MAPIISTTVARASPQVIWKTCLDPAKFELWDDDVETITDVSGECKNGTSTSNGNWIVKKWATKCTRHAGIVNWF